MADRFRNWTALDASARSGKRSGVVAYAQALEPRLHAFVAFRAETSFAPGPLNGLPYAAKDLFFAPDRAPMGGLAAPLPPAAQAEVLSRLDAAGGLRIGYTAMTELAYEPSGHNARGRVRNPWNLDRISGGSSSGSAAAVASGSAVVALGSDTGGSLRIPAHACGVTAWKPTHRAVPALGAMPLAPSLDTVGLLGRSAADMQAPAAALLTTVSETAKPRSAAVLEDVFAATEAPVANACRNGVAALADCSIALIRREGLATIEALDPPLFTIMQAEAARSHRDLLTTGALEPVLAKRLAKGLAIDDDMLFAALASRAQLCAGAIAQLFGDADVLVLPVLPITTPAASLCDPSSASFDPKTLYALSRWTRFVNLLGFPAVAVPVGHDDRHMPVAMQIIGRPHSDLALLALAVALQERTRWHGLVPHAVADLALVHCADELL